MKVSGIWQPRGTGRDRLHNGKPSAKHSYSTSIERAEHHPKSRDAETLADWLGTVAKIQTSNEEFYRLFRRALEDMAALRLPIKGTDHTVFLPVVH